MRVADVGRYMRTRSRDVARDDEASSGGGSGQASPRRTAEDRGRTNNGGCGARWALILAVIGIILCNSGWSASQVSDPEAARDITNLKPRRRNKERDERPNAAPAALRASNPAVASGSSAWQTEAVPLPDPTQGSALKKRLEAACGGQPAKGTGRLPSKLHVRGLPADGNRRLSKFLHANLMRNVAVTSAARGAGAWANLPPFHPDAEETIVDNCRNRTGGAAWSATVYVVRSPLTWISSLNTEDYELKQCMDERREQCFFPSCSSPANGCVETSTPRGWRFSNPLDLWAAYATHLPSTPVTLVVQYETFLTTPRAVLQAVTAHFGLVDTPLPPMRSGGDSKVNKHRQIWLNLQRLHALVGNKEGDRASTMLRSKNSNQNDRGKCASVMAAKELFETSLLAALRSAEERHVLPAALNETGYQVLHSSAANAMLKSCSLSHPTRPTHTGLAGTSSLETCTDWDWEVIAGTHSGIDAAKTRRMNDLKELAEPIPGPASQAETTRSLEEACLAKRKALGPGPRGPPKEIHVRGLPNTGTNAYQTLLGATFNVTILTGERTTGKLWKHILPSHPDLQAMITDTYCPSDNVATVFVVRHPVAWMLSQMSPGHNYGSFCDDRADATGDACFFSACHVRMKQWCNANFSTIKRKCLTSGRTLPRYWRFPTLLDLWAAWVSYVPDTPVTVLVRYEDLLTDPEEVLKKIAGKFNLPFRPQQPAKGDGSSSIPINVLEGYSRPFEKGYKHSSTGIQDSKGRWESFRRFWRQEFSSSSSTDGPQSALRGGSNASSGTYCARSDPIHHLLNPSQLRSLRSGEARGVLNSMALALGYEVPGSDKAQRAWEMCASSSPSHQQPPAYTSSTSQRPNRQSRRRPTSRFRASNGSGLRPPGLGLPRHMMPSRPRTMHSGLSRGIIRPHQERI